LKADDNQLALISERAGHAGADTDTELLMYGD
jgi:hypothetical protein